MKSICFCSAFIVLLINNLFAQCDSVCIAISDGNLRGINKVTSHFSASGKLLSRETIKKLYPFWVPQERDEYSYDSNDSLISELNYTWQDTSWQIIRSRSLTYTATGKHHTEVMSIYPSTIPVAYADSFTYDNQDRILYHYNFNGGILSRTTYSYNSFGNDTLLLKEDLNGSGIWDPVSKITRSFDQNGYLAEEYQLEYNLSTWDSISDQFYFYGGDSLLDTLIVQDHATPPVTSMELYEYGFNDHLDIRTSLNWNGSEWIYGRRNIDQVNTLGNTTFWAYCYATYDSTGFIQFDTIEFINYYYDSLGNLLSYYGNSVNFSGSTGEYIYTNGVLTSSTNSYFAHHYDDYWNTEYFYGDITGDSIICSGGVTTLSVDSCPGRTYLWSNGETTPTIVVVSGVYYVDITYPSGNTFRTPPRTVINPTIGFQIGATSCAGCADGFIFAGTNFPSSLNTYSISPVAGIQDYDDFYALPAGIYEYCMTDSLGCITCTNITIQEDPTGTSEINSEEVSVFPNPTSEFITISSDDRSLFEKYSVENIFGEIIMDGKLQGNLTTIQLHQLPSGMYFIRFSGTQRSIIKIVKE